MSGWPRMRESGESSCDGDRVVVVEEKLQLGVAVLVRGSRWWWWWCLKVRRVLAEGAPRGMRN